MGRNEAIEALLVERNDPLITLGLACYGTSEEVFTALYKHGLAKPADTADERYKLGLRIGCLSNRSVVAAHWVRDFPRRLCAAAARTSVIRGALEGAERLRQDARTRSAWYQTRRSQRQSPFRARLPARAQTKR
jgi:hypothetical protein